MDRLKNFTSFALPFSFLFATTSLAAFILVFGLKLIIMKEYPSFAPVNVFIGIKIRPVREIIENPFPYLLSISFFLSLLGALWISLIAPKLRKFHKLQAFAIPWIAMFLTSPVWGLIWSINLKPPENFLNVDSMMYVYKYHTTMALNLGWISALFSFPTNILSFVITYSLLIISKKLYLPDNASN